MANEFDKILKSVITAADQQIKNAQKMMEFTTGLGETAKKPIKKNKASASLCSGGRVMVQFKDDKQAKAFYDLLT